MTEIRQNLGINPPDGGIVGGITTPKLEAQTAGIDVAGAMVQGEPPKLSAKQAKDLVKNYMKENEATKKEAKAKFKEEFGYDMPQSKFSKIMNIAMFVVSTPNPVALHRDLKELMSEIENAYQEASFESGDTDITTKKFEKEQAKKIAMEILKRHIGIRD